MTLLQRRARALLLGIDDVLPGDNIFHEDRDAFWVNRKQIAHRCDDTSFELRLTRKLISAHRPRLKSDPRVELRRGASDWIIVRCERAADIGLLAELAELAAAAHRPADGSPPRPPAIGPALERMRRFH